MTTEAAAELVACSFCGKSQDEVQSLIAGLAVYICDECIDLCNRILSAKRSRAAAVHNMVRAISEAACLAFGIRYVVPE